MQEIAKDSHPVLCPGETIALLLHTESPLKTVQRVVSLEQALGLDTSDGSPMGTSPTTSCGQWKPSLAARRLPILLDPTKICENH